MIPAIVVMEGDHGTPDDSGWGFKTMPGVLHRFPEGWHVVAGDGERVPDLPATVLYEPEDGRYALAPLICFSIHV